MKNSTLVSTCLFLPLLWFLGYIAMIIVGCVASCFGATDAFYCGFYCKFSIALMALLTGGFVAYISYKYYKKCKS